MKKRPNILLITSDQQHFNTIGAFNKEIITPNLDRLVREGTTFDRAYCPNPTCTPTRGSIITGKYPSQHGAWTLGVKLPETENTIGNEFRKAGYKSALIGKAHFQPLASTLEFPSLEAYPCLQDLEFWRSYKGIFYGFDHVELARNHTNEAHVGQHYALWLEEKGCKNWRDYYLESTGNMSEKEYPRLEILVEQEGNILNSRRNWGKWEIPEKYHYNTWIAERTNKMLEEYKNNDESFFLWASFFDPHPEYFVPEPWASMYDPEKLTINGLVPGEHLKNPPHFQKTQEENPNFDEYKETGFGIHGMHSHLQKIEDIKKDLALYYGMVSMMDKYIGEILNKLDELGLAEDTIVVFTTDHGHFVGQHGLIRKGPFHYEDLIKVPFIVRYPNHVPENKVSSSIQSLVDLAPTFLSFCDLKIPYDMTGIDQKKVWENPDLEVIRDHAICENHHEPTTIHLKTYVDKRYKITVYYNKTYGELYDLQEDPNEINNLWDNEDYKELKSELLLKYIWAELGKEPMWMPRIKQA